MFFKYMLSNHLYTPCRPIPNLQTLHNNSEISVACFFPAITTGPINHLNGRETGHFFFQQPLLLGRWETRPQNYCILKELALLF